MMHITIRERPMNLTYVLFDVAVLVIALRSLAVLGMRALWTSTGWAATAAYFASAAWRYAHAGPQPGAMLVAEGFFVILAIAFIVAVVRDEPQAEPLLWPTRIGLTRAQKRR
jgi:hypothetical protein